MNTREVPWEAAKEKPVLREDMGRRDALRLGAREDLARVKSGQTLGRRVQGPVTACQSPRSPENSALKPQSMKADAEGSLEARRAQRP